MAFPMIRGGFAVKSSTCTKFSGIQLVALAGSTFRELAISASFRSRVMAMFDGGPMTEFGTSLTVSTDGGNLEKSRMESVSGPLGAMTCGAPDVSSTFVSLPEIMSCAKASTAGRNNEISKSGMILARVISLGNRGKLGGSAEAGQG